MMTSKTASALVPEGESMLTCPVRLHQHRVVQIDWHTVKAARHQSSCATRLSQQNSMIEKFMSSDGWEWMCVGGEVGG